jgi:TRAP-type mannitol/chloroaromatic compound transport system permease small subunit
MMIVVAIVVVVMVGLMGILGHGGYPGRCGSAAALVATAYAMVILAMTHPFAQIAEKAAGAIDRMNAAIGRAAAWCCLYIVVVDFALVVMRYVFGIGSIRMQESVMYAHAALFLLAAAWVLQSDGHVRVDISYSEAKPRTKAVINLFGAIVFLAPFAVALVMLSVPYVARSWRLLERSPEASGLPFVYLLKTLIPLFALLLGLQGIAQAIRAGLVLGGRR